MNSLHNAESGTPQVSAFPSERPARPRKRFPVSRGSESHPITGISLDDFDLFHVGLHPSATRTRPATPAHVMLGRASSPVVIHPDQGPIVTVGTGQLFVTQSTCGFVTACQKETRVTGIVFPASRLSQMGVRRPTQEALVLPPSTLAEPMWRFIDSLLEQPLPWHPFTAGYALHVVTHLVSSVLLEANAVPHLPPLDRSLVDRARQHMVAYAHDPRLTPQKVADSLQVPLRRLQRRFNDVDSSVGLELRQARSRIAISLIQSLEGADLDMDAVARRSGYLNAIAMRRSFAQLGLDQPRSYRRRR
ncbi:hypothetical protein [Demetria terragena]|uniref:hypothetical protein n=1 Tax=Demetria terragena TaxID=63959 RepID=UPI000372B0B6|nr:hypothetical protein [Demetria terragena]